MRMTLVALLLVAGVLPAWAQTLTERLQKAIYTEQTLGNPQAAIEIYREILAMTPAHHQVARQARERLEATIARHPSAAEAAGQVVTIGPRAYSVGGQREPLGTFANGRYRHTWSGIEFSVPDGWDVSETGASSDHGEQVALRHTDSGVTLSVWMIKESTPPEALRARLDGAPAEKVRQRKSGYSIPGFIAETYTIPGHSVQQTWIGGRQAIQAIGEYMGRIVPVEWETSSSRRGNIRVLPTRRLLPDPERMNEYMTWIYSENSRAFFFARVSPEELATFRPLLDTIIQSAVVP